MKKKMRMVLTQIPPVCAASANTCIAENHPSTEYPDEEVDSDDEFDRNPYVFRKGSDDEEFDEDEATFSDEDEDIIGKMKSWSRKPAWMRSEREKEEAQEEEFDY